MTSMMTTMTIYDDDDTNLRWRRMRHSTPQANHTSSVQWLTTAQAVAMYGLPKQHAHCLPYTRPPRPGDESSSGSPQPNTRKLLSGFPSPE
ncbi:hypothetical protein PoB_003540500 [Plakobranchus ocellatus]|uniref:Uncharacterized protein n=1 Tax=Plakobranchus ocellatus TaxID=259542 RepID=A0AAV4ANH3_9GAST|nr:hypothetical protein PoB_003540500 [Plakobranchus ocellatus]